MSKVIYEERDWEAEIQVTELANDGIRIKIGNGTPKGFYAVNLSQSEVEDLWRALGKKVPLFRAGVRPSSG